MQWSEPEDARKPDRGWRLYVFKGGEVKDTLHLHRQSAYLVGRHEVADLRVRRDDDDDDAAAAMETGKKGVWPCTHATLFCVPPRLRAYHAGAPGGAPLVLEAARRHPVPRAGRARGGGNSQARRQVRVVVCWK